MAALTSAAEVSTSPLGDSGFADLSEAELLEWIAEGEKCPAESSAAFVEFHSRHAKYLYSQSRRRYPQIYEEIVQDTFLKVSQRAGTFDRRRLGLDGSADTDRRLVRAWLGKIAHRVAAKYFLARKLDAVTNPDTKFMSEDWDRESKDGAGEFASELILEVRTVIDGFPEVHREICWKLAHYLNSDDPKNTRWPRGVIAAIAEEYGETPENVRQIKCRLITKLKGKLTPAVAAARVTGVPCPTILNQRSSAKSASPMPRD